MKSISGSPNKEIISKFIIPQGETKCNQKGCGGLFRSDCAKLGTDRFYRRRQYLSLRLHEIEE
jgi:hypothetical protein